MVCIHCCYNLGKQTQVRSPSDLKPLGVPMKAVTVILALLFGAQALATEAKPLVMITSANMLSGTTQTITLKDNGLVYIQESSYIDDSSTREKAFARVQSQEQLTNILAAIEKVPAGAQLSQPDFELCEIDSAYSVQIFDQKFSEGSLTIKTADCADGTKIVGKNAHWAKAIVRLIESAYDVL